MTVGFEVLVQLVMAAMITEPSSTSSGPRALVVGLTRVCPPEAEAEVTEEGDASARLRSATYALE
jgi:hypothetical protein